MAFPLHIPGNISSELDLDAGSSELILPEFLPGIKQIFYLEKSYLYVCLSS